MSNPNTQRFRGRDNSENADVDNIDFIENEDDVQNVASAAANDDDEIDPLDAFMEGIHEEVKSALPPKPKAKAERYKDDEDDDHVIEPIQALDHSSIDYEPINKDIYDEVESISKMSEQEALDCRHSLGIRTFEDCGFSSQMMSAIKKQAYEKPTTIQCQALPVELSGRDIIGIAKTAAFVLPMIVHIMDQPELQREEGPIGVICAPTRELAHQIYLEAKKILKTLTMMRASYLVLDEADRMFDLGFEPQVRSIVGQIRPDRQTLLFSAIMPWKVEKVTVGEAGMANEDITQVVSVIPSDADKLPWLLEKLPGMIDEGDVLVFASKKATVDEVEAQLTLNAFKVAALHGDKDQASRMETLQKFKSGIYHVLVATDVAARGLDIKSLKTVVNYDTAKDMDMHVHRIGRTGRAGDKDGVAYTLVTQREARFAGELINNLVAAGQNVPPEPSSEERPRERKRRSGWDD
ncbi:hypothetical protein N665_0129s0079 [Sinapis alba]|nr:hypothetical protein N665_0129s0079 [Sinapis alba]